MDKERCGGEGIVRLQDKRGGKDVSFSHIDAPLERDEFMFREGVVIESENSAFIHRLAESANRALQDTGDGSYRTTRLPVKEGKARLYISDTALERLQNADLTLMAQEQERNRVTAQR